ncbi:MAG TPA: glycosyltransferase family 4 protein [Acidocella sp.]|jgi:succinoglycan biosynthesis protein ExoO|uniref:glycosyltransferase n=1 Tax=Acidocella sp. TaxID=50710 RepID=UPI002C991596|nr:glycosyltransferase family 4 protein [Acidocella sp.]HVE22469.1 glycosyltransferase family 4 protein [Acidocella sp.]
MRYVFLTDELPRPGSAGHLAMNHAIISWLQGLDHQVTVLLLGARLAWPAQRYGIAPVAGPQIVARAGHVLPRSPRALAAILLRAAVRFLPPPAARWVRRRRHQADAVLGQFCSAAEADWAARYIASEKPDAVLVDTLFRAAPLAAPALRGINSVIIAHDVFHRRHRALAEAGYSVQPQRLTCADEIAALSGARCIAAIQHDEAALLQKLCPTQHVLAAPMPASPCPPPAGWRRTPRRLVFVGSANLPNLDGLRWFFTEIWPRLGGNISLDLIGDCGAALRAVPAGVTRHGRVQDLRTQLHDASLAISPLRVGSGLKIKLLDYARHGLVTVATPCSLEGFAPDVSAPFVAASSPEDFAAAILKQLAVPARSGLALDYVTRHYSLEASFSALRAALEA